MFTSPPPDWVKECLKEWAEKQGEKEQVSRLGERRAISKSNTPSTERVCFYNEQEAQQARTHKKPSPPDHVSFF